MKEKKFEINYMTKVRVYRLNTNKRQLLFKRKMNKMGWAASNATSWEMASGIVLQSSSLDQLLSGKKQNKKYCKSSHLFDHPNPMI